MLTCNAFLFGAYRVAQITVASVALLTSACDKRDAPSATDSATEAPTKQGPESQTKQEPTTPLWKPIQWEGSYEKTPQAIRSIAVEIDSRLLEGPTNDRFKLVLPGGTEITAHKTTLENVGDGQFVWRGTIEDGGGSVTFSVVNDKVVGDIVTARGKMYRVRFVEKGISVVEQLSPGKFPAEEPIRLPVQDSAQREYRRFKGAIEKSPVIDVLVLYTSAAGNYSADPDAITATINEAISDTNQSYVNSALSQRVRLVGKQAVGYQEKSDIVRDWRALKGTSDPDLPEAHTLRKSHSADIVVLITKAATENESCGQSSQMQMLSTSECEFAFAVVPVNCVTGTHSFAHELGHLMGADHNAEMGTNSPPFGYSHGYETPSKAWHTIMASPTVTCTGEECPPRAPHWSNPQISYSPDSSPPLPTGLDGTNNNALALSETASIVANFFPSPECGQPTTPLPPQNISTQ
jgi:peptidyl-Asp metalloendopeptidase